MKTERWFFIKTHIISHPDNKHKRYEFTPVASPPTRIRIRSYGFAGEERLDSLMQISVARAFWKDKVSQGWLVTKTDIDNMHSLYMKNKEKHDKDFYRYDNYALEA